METTDSKEHYLDFLQLSNSTRLLPAYNTLSQQQHQQLHSYIDGLRNGQWADNLAVHGVADMLNINIQVINTITPDWTHDIQPRKQRSENTITIGLLGEQHYVALENAETEFRKQSEEKKKQQDLEDEEDRIAFKHTSKLRGIPYDTLLQEEGVADGDNTYSVAPGENQKPCPFLTDDKFEELANPSKYPYGRGGLSEERERVKDHSQEVFKPATSAYGWEVCQRHRLSPCCSVRSGG